MPDLSSRAIRLSRIATAAVAVLLVGGCVGATTVLCSRTSPDGERTVENVIVDQGEGFGRIVLHGKRGGGGSYDYNDGTADIFFRWSEDRRLEVWREAGGAEAYAGPARLGDVDVVRRTYPIVYDVLAAFDDRSIPTEAFEIDPSKVASTFVARVDGKVRRCVMTLAANPEKAAGPALVRVEARVNPYCGRPRPCSGVDAVLEQGDGRHDGRQTMLTAATIAHIPSAVRLSSGLDGSAVRGQFLGESASSLVKALKGREVTLEFSFDFASRLLVYILPLVGTRKDAEAFEACVGNADSSWLEH